MQEKNSQQQDENIQCKFQFSLDIQTQNRTHPSFNKIYNNLFDLSHIISIISVQRYRYPQVNSLMTKIKSYIGLNQIYNLSMKRERAQKSEKLDFKQLIKHKKEQEERLKNSSNPFLSVAKKPDYSIYNQLYKFDMKQELQDYNLPFSHPQDVPSQAPNKAMAASKVSSLFDQSDAQSNSEQSGLQEKEAGRPNYSQIVKGLYREQSQKPQNKIQNALFVDKSVSNILKTIKTGDVAISFFAKYGNTTPIKFINCIQKTSSEEFRPYDLEVIASNENQKESAFDEYYTISAHGIVKVYSQRLKKQLKAEGKEQLLSTQVVGLSDWMHESTLFNIITNIGFFKRYTITKIFNIWKKNVRYRSYLKIRQRLVSDAFIAKPTFAENLMELNRNLFDLQQNKTIFSKISDNKTWQKGDFNYQQDQTRKLASGQYQTIIGNKMTVIVRKVQNQIYQKCNLKDVDDQDQMKFGQQVKQKPMNLKRREEQQKAYLLQIANRDRQRLPNFVRLVDYVMIETLVSINHQSMNILLEEMKKERKAGLFNIGIKEQHMNFDPNEEELRQNMESTLKNMIEVVKGVHRIPTQIRLGSEEKHEKLPDIGLIITQSVEFNDVRGEMLDKIRKDFKVAGDYIEENYQQVRQIFSFLNTFQMPNWEEGNVTFQEIRQKIHKFTEWNSFVKSKIKDIARGCLNINGIKISNKLTSQLQSKIDIYRKQLSSLMVRRMNETKDTIDKFTKSLEPYPELLKEYGEYIENFNFIMSKNKGLQNQKIEIESMQSQLKKLDGNISRDQTGQLQLLKEKYANLQNQLKKAQEVIDKKREAMDQSIKQSIKILSRNIKNIEGTLMRDKLIDENCPANEALRQLDNVQKNILKQKQKNDAYVKVQKLMGIPPAPNKQLQDVQVKFNDRKLLWNHVDRFIKLQENWEKSNIRNFDSEDIQKEVQQFELTVFQLKIRITNLSKEGRDRVLEAHEARIKSIVALMPIIVSVANKDLRDKHWKKIYDKLDQPMVAGKAVSLTELLVFGIMDKKESIEEISARATGERQIESQLEQIQQKWGSLNFIVNNYREAKDKFIIGSVEEIMQTLDDHQLKIQSMMGSRYVAQIRESVEIIEKRLLLISQIIDQWLTCQRQWMYLENIFSAEDIQKQLPEENKKFIVVDKFWKDIMVKTFKRPLVYDCCASEELLRKFQKNNKQLQQIQKKMEDYLEVKRGAFPRFYFLSNDELLQILSQTRNPHAVQAHLRKCFDNINRIEFTDVEQSKQIVSMTSAEPETMPEVVRFSASVFAEGPVENWLMRIQEMMVKSLYDVAKQALKEYPNDDPLNRQKWLFSYNAQNILLVDLIKWTEGVTEAVLNEERNPKKGIKLYQVFMREMITKMVAIVRKDLNILQRTLMGALIVLDVHARDVVTELMEKQVKNLNDFEFSKQLRYYWDVQIDDCLVKQTNTSFQYGYQYLGNGPRLVITPLTDKCYITLTSAKHLQFGGAPAGPAGTGKTQTTKDLAKALAVQCVVFNCSDGLDYKTMGRFFSGLAQGGAWACFDEFNRIDIEVLSVIAQQILTIQQSIKRGEIQFEFETRIIPLNKRFGVFITMNPGYAGRTELPDNLKALFRPVAMMIPDYALIAEIILFSEGFETAKSLARKMVQLYKLSSEQLSKQDHYDFGMRAVKSVLVMAGALRRKQAKLAEDVVLIRAMRDSNVPKFLEHDLPLFMGIIADLFPRVQIPNIDYGSLQRAIEHQLELKNYQKPKKFLTKIIQLMETIMVRHGVMVVGLTGTGKTTVIQTLAKSCEQLHKEGSTDYYHKMVKQERLNPKSVTMNELFGYTNILTNEWTDGIVAAIVRSNVADTTETKKWIIFDGPVDALWIENMNTVLDDNKMLCLSNGQRIKLPQTFTMMFEVNDLSVASPATVSRCGMVYLEPIHLGWEPIIETWSITFKEEKKKDNIVPPYVINVIEKMKTLFRENLVWLREECKEVIVSADNNLVQSCINIFNILFGELTTKQNLDKMSNFDADSCCSMVLIFAFVWSAGANLWDSGKDNSRMKFSHSIKNKILKFYSSFPYEGEIFDYFIDFDKKEFHNWTELVTEYKYDPEIPYFNILVPTGDTVRYKYLINKLVQNRKNVLVSGETGVGKSVIVGDFLGSMELDKFSYTIMNFSAQTSTKNVLDVFLDKDKFTKKRRTEIGPLGGKKMVFFVDDINMPALQKFGAQPPNELLRQIIDQGGFYDLKKFLFMEISDCVFISCCAPPGGGRNKVSPRLFRHFNMVWAPDLSVKSMDIIFTSILKGFLSFSKGLEKFAPSIVKSSLQIYGKIRSQLLPTPTKSHYTFNLRDLSKVFQGILEIQIDNLQNKETLVSLWIHETQRIFYDRLVDQKDRTWFFGLLQGYLQNNFQLDWEQTHLKQIVFGDYNNAQGKYMKIDDLDSLPKKFSEYLAKHNGQYPGKAMSLVFFKDAILHLSKICRILKQNRGNALLIGVGGSGRQSLTRLASSIRDYKIFTIEITKNYKDPQWKDDLKNLLKTAGKNEQVTFLFSDTQIVKQSFLEDLNNILNTGQVPNMWGPEDYDEILNEMRALASKEKEKIIDTRENLMKLFNQKTRQNLHIVLAFSPVGQKLRNRCRQFPSIINCCTIDWFDRWPNEALYSVATKQFKANETIGIGQFAEKLSEMCVHVHNSVIDYSQTFYGELRRKNYVTPMSYLELLKLYIEMMKYQQGVLPTRISKYTVGLQTLKETNEQVAKLQAKIIEMQPKLEEFAKETAEMVIQLEKQTKSANDAEAICAKDTNQAQVKRDEVNELKNICQTDLNKAIPILNKAKDAVGSIDKKGLQEMKVYAQPPAMVELVLKAVCLILGEKETWDDAKKKVLNRLDLLEALSSFKAGTMTEKQVKRLREGYLNDADFDPDKVQKVSAAAKGLCIWVGAVEALFRVEKEVQPKKAKLKKAQQSLKIVESQLSIKQKSLKQIQDKVASLQRNYEATLRKSQSLQQQKQIAAIQLVRAQKLVGGLAGEAERWKVNVAILQQDFKNLIGNIVLASATVAYIGPFTSEYRTKMIRSWIDKCKQTGIPVSDDYQLARILSNEVQIRDWQENGLPTDQLSIDNGIFIFNCRRWPLIIDPQGQANKWIKSMYKDSHMHITKLSETNFLKILQNAIRNGQVVLMENIEEELDPSLQPVLGKQLMKKGQQWLLRLGDQDVPYNADFKFYLTTKLSNPHYIPEICIKTTIINFTVTPKGLQDQLLAEVVRFERIELQTKRIELILQISADKKQLQELQDKILRQISEAQGRILEDQALINTLDASKVTSETVNQRIELAKVTSQQIDKARQQYRSIAKRGSVIYFVISDLSVVDPMYQYSLDFFMKLFKRRLELTQKKDKISERISLLINDITESFYLNICRGLFEKDKLLYSFMISSKILIYDGLINDAEWNFYLRGGLGTIQMPASLPPFITEKLYKDFADLANISQTFKNVVKDLTDVKNQSIWKNILEADDPISIKLPDNLELKLDSFQKMVIYKLLREEKLISLIKNFVLNNLGKIFIESPVFDLKGSFADSTPTTPIIFVLSPGADPISYLLALAKQKEMDTRLKMLSLGQGQGKFAKELIFNGRKNGDWVCLQNCHLAVSWMSPLEKIQQDQIPQETHPDYRLWLTSMPSKSFPVPVLQSSIKITNEPPKGLKANLLRSYNDISEKTYNSCTKTQVFKQLLFSLAFFHAVILQRRKYGAIGWNIPYEWMNSDFQTSFLQLKMYLDEQAIIPYKTLNYLIAEINYGGRVTDDKDVRLITALLLSYLNSGVMKGQYNFSSSGVYHNPLDLQLEAVKSYISSLPLEDDPQIYGLHRNANITFQQKNVKQFFETLLSIQPRASGSAKSGETPDEIGERMAKEIESRMPDLLPIRKIDDPNSLDIFRMQQVERFNALISIIKRSLSDLQKAIKGTVVMSIQLQNMFLAFLDKKVPEIWQNAAYPSLKPLASWVNDFIERVIFFRQWVENNNMNSYWASAFFFPQGFMTAAMQSYARRTHIAIDTLMFSTEIRSYFMDEVTEPPKDGVNIHGLFIEGCRCDKKTGFLEQSQNKVLFTQIPVIWLQPVVIETYKPKDTIFQCPLYKTSTRKGVLSTTGHSTNFVMFMGVKTKQDPQHWVRRGVAMLCQLDD